VDSGERALEWLMQRTPDLVVLDAMMPGLDGFATCERLRRMPGMENVPVLMLTGLDDEASITRAYRVGATDFFVKATQWSLLAGRLRYLLRSSRTRLELERSKSAHRTSPAWAASTGAPPATTRTACSNSPRRRCASSACPPARR
jgi:DNA-binding response OmpR family regulator